MAELSGTRRDGLLPTWQNYRNYCASPNAQTEARSAKAEAAEKDPKRALRHRGPSPVLATLMGSSGRRP
jgi:hypothetical protein